MAIDGAQGHLAAHVRTDNAGGCGAGYFYQDIPQLAVNESFELSSWVYPVFGSPSLSSSRLPR